MEIEDFNRSVDLYQQGQAASLGFNEPERLKELLPRKRVTYDDVPPMLRKPKGNHGRT